MRKLFVAILEAARLTADGDGPNPVNKLSTIFSAQKLMGGAIVNPLFKSALLNNDKVVGSPLSHTFTATAMMIEEVAQFDPIMNLIKDIKEAWLAVQTKKSNAKHLADAMKQTNNDIEAAKLLVATQQKKPKISSYNADELVCMIRGLVPGDFSVNEIKMMRSYVEKLSTQMTKLNGDVYDEYRCTLASLEGAIMMELPADERLPSFLDQRAEDNLDAPLLANDRVHPEETNSDEVEEAIKILRQKDAAQQQYDALKKNALDEAQLTNIRNAKIEMIDELNTWFKAQRELTIAYQIHEQCTQYKAVLAVYIKNEIANNDNPLHESCFANNDARLNMNTAQIADAIMQNDDNNATPRTVQLKTFAKNNPNFARAVANYKLIDDAEIKLKPSNGVENQPEHLVDRLKGFYRAYPAIESNLQTVGNEAVDNATKGFVGFFKKLFSSISWYFSDAGKKEREFKKSAQNHREKFFTVLQNQPVVQAPVQQAPASDVQQNAVQPVLPGVSVR